MGRKGEAEEKKAILAKEVNVRRASKSNSEKQNKMLA